MTNKEKERLKDFVSDGASFIEGWRSNHSTKTKEKIEEEIDRDKKTILSLLDNVPSEKEARIAMGFLRGKIMPNCAWQRKIVSCCQCDWHDDCKSVIKTFRKSLNIEGKE